MNCVEVFMHYYILTDKEIWVNLQRKERAKYHMQLCLRINNCEPSDANAKPHLDLQNRPDAVEHNWEDAEAMGTLSVMSIRPI